MEKSRVEYSLKNAGVAMAGKIVAIILGYLTRVVFTHVLNSELLGVNGLLMNLLDALSMANLGINTALVYSMYEPFANDDYSKQRALLKRYRKIYFVIAGLILLFGLILFPYFNYLVSVQQLNVEHTHLIYGVFVFNCALSYIYGYYSVVFLAAQRNYVNDLINSFCLIVLNLLQITVLIFSHNYILYISMYLICTILINALTTYRARRDYPYLNEDESKTLSKDDLDGLNRNVRAILLHKIDNTLINNIDNLVITSMAGFQMVGIYSIYYLIIGSIRQVLERGIHGIAGSLGNLGVSDDKEKVYPVFELVFFITVFLFGYFAIAIFEIINLFVEFSFGKLYVFSSVIVAVLCLNFFLNGVRQATLTFRDSLGLFYKDRYKTIVESLINLFFSIVLTRYYGIIGVFVATSISIITV